MIERALYLAGYSTDPCSRGRRGLGPSSNSFALLQVQSLNAYFFAAHLVEVDGCRGTLAFESSRPVLVLAGEEELVGLVVGLEADVSRVVLQAPGAGLGALAFVGLGE